jgi:class 3 adenylate cyclase
MGHTSAELPQGVLTFLLTDIEGSTPLWERHGVVMGAAVARHQELIARTVAAHAGQVIKTQGEGDSTLSVFARASDAVAAALSRWEEAATHFTTAVRAHERLGAGPLLARSRSALERALRAREGASA